MVTTISFTDRLRIERAVWTLDLLTQGLPGRSRRNIRQEVRANLQVASAEVGSAQAVRRLGGLRGLAAGYLDTEYGPGRPRPRWLWALFWALAVEAVLLALAFVGHSAFVAGVQAADAQASGTYTWQSLRSLGIGGDVTFDRGTATGFGITVSAWMLPYLAAALVLGGRLWRLPAAWWRNRHPAPTGIRQD